jgi:cobalamin biosynthesis protein CbiG
MSKNHLIIKRKVSTISEIDALIAELQELKQQMSGGSLTDNEKLVMERIKDGVYRKDLDALKIENLSEILIKLRPHYLSIGDKKGLRLISK